MALGLIRRCWPLSLLDGLEALSGSARYANLTSATPPIGTGAICPICKKPVGRSVPAQLSPFLIARCKLDVRTRASSNLCDSCEHVFFTPFLAEEDLDRLYDGYRGHIYNQERLKSEPAYRVILEELERTDSSYYSSRLSLYDEFADLFLNVDGVVTDFGGFDGYFSRYAFPHADVVVLERDYRSCGIDAPALLRESAFFFCANVLQASPRPTELLADNVRYLKPGTPVWIELPKQYPGSLKASFGVEEARSIWGLPPTSPLRQVNENLGHFSLKSAQILLLNSGINVLQIIRTNIGIAGFYGLKA